MEPRIVSRTHYQVDEPAYMTLLCKLCASGSQSAYHDVLAQRLEKVLRDRGKEFNIAAGGYAVDLAKALGLLTTEHALAERGHLVHLIGEVKEGTWEEQLRLTPAEVLLYFRSFLEGDGAALVFLGRRILEGRTLPSGDATWNDLATEMFAETYLRYLEITNNTADRVALRQRRDRLLAKPYEGKGGPHKAFIHMQTLYRLGLVTRVSSGSGRTYGIPSPMGSRKSAIEVFVTEVPDVRALGQVIQRRQWVQVAARVFYAGQGFSDSLEPEDESGVLSTVAARYQQVLATGAPLCPLSTLIDSVQIDMLVTKARLVTYEHVLNILTNLQRERPKDVRFHVDRRGQPAYLKLSDEIQKTLTR